MQPHCAGLSEPAQGQGDAAVVCEGELIVQAAGSADPNGALVAISRLRPLRLDCAGPPKRRRTKVAHGQISSSLAVMGLLSGTASVTQRRSPTTGRRISHSSYSTSLIAGRSPHAISLPTWRELKVDKPLFS